MGKYFDRFPLVEYNGVLAKNLLTKVSFTDQTKKDIYSNFDYTLSDLSRPDLLSSVNYGSSYYDWLIYLANDIIDPYHDYYKQDEDLNAFIIGKYGSIAASKEVILYYRNNWAPDESNIQVSLYDSLHSNIQKYYTPEINASNQVTGYVRKKEDWIRSTNKVIQLTVEEDTALLNVGDKYIAGAGSGYIVGLTETAIILHHIEGLFSLSSNITAINTIVTNIPDEEAPFWVQITAYDDEVEKNEVKKHITLIKSSYLSDMDKKFQEQIKK